MLFFQQLQTLHKSLLTGTITPVRVLNDTLTLFSLNYWSLLWLLLSRKWWNPLDSSWTICSKIVILWGIFFVSNFISRNSFAADFKPKWCTILSYRLIALNGDKDMWCKVLEVTHSLWITDSISPEFLSSGYLPKYLSWFPQETFTSRFQLVTTGNDSPWILIGFLPKSLSELPRDTSQDLPAIPIRIPLECLSRMSA